MPLSTSIKRSNSNQIWPKPTPTAVAQRSRFGRHENAIADYDKAIQLKPDLADAYSNRGNAKGRLERYEDAITDFDKAIQLEPDMAEAYSNRGNAKGGLGRYEDAIIDYDKAIQLKPDLAECLLQPR